MRFLPELHRREALKRLNHRIAGFSSSSLICFWLGHDVASPLTNQHLLRSKRRSYRVAGAN